MLLAACIIFAVLGVSSGETVDENLSFGEGIVAFTAAYDSDHHLKHNQTLVLNKVITNHGSGYNSSTGSFIAPKSGIYLFQFHALTTKNSTLSLSLYHNNDYVISVWARNNRDYDAAGNMAILRLKKSDRVYLKALWTASFYGRPEEIYTTFSGHSIGLLCDCDDV